MLDNFIDVFWHGDGKYLVIAFVVLLTLVWFASEWENAEFHPWDQKVNSLDEQDRTTPQD